MFICKLTVSVLVVFATTIFNSNAQNSENIDNAETTLRQVHVLFRHGDRANDAGTTYPNDPHINVTYQPYGIGQLTNAGREREFMIGQYLRKKYHGFLGSLYTVDILDAMSTNLNRTKMSLQLVTAGLFPPVHTDLEWNKFLNWQPIPYNYVPFEQDKLLTLSLFYCPNYAKHYQAYLSSASGIQVQEKYSELYPYLTKHTGRTVATIFDIYILWFGLEAELEWGLQLPRWTINVFPKFMERAAIDQYLIGSATNKLKQLSGGLLLKKVVNDMKAKRDNVLVPAGRKIFLYSAHEMNVGYFLNALEVYYPHVPPYGAYVIVELHQIKNVHYVKILYQDYSKFEPQLLTVPGCEPMCSFNKFVKILRKNIPEEDNPCGDDVSLVRDFEHKKLYFNEH